MREDEWGGGGGGAGRGGTTRGHYILTMNHLIGHSKIFQVSGMLCSNIFNTYIVCGRTFNYRKENNKHILN